MKKLKIRSNSMMATIGTAGSASSWAYTIYSLAKSFLKTGNDVSLITTNGIKGVPKELLKCFKECSEPHIDFTYATPNNWGSRFQGSYAGTTRAKIRCGIFNYESSVLPVDWTPHHKYVDYVLPSSEYCADVFIKSGIPEEKVIVMPLGIDFDSLNAPIDTDFKLNTKKKFKLLNVSIPHMRKNIGPLVDAYFEEFSADDDICLIVKTTIAGKKDHFEIDVNAVVNQLKQKHMGKKLPELLLLEHRFNNMATLYKSADALINVAASEGFGLPLLEMMACGGLVAAPRYGGVLDFLDHKKNALLIDTKEIRAEQSMQYWQAHPSAMIGEPVKESIQLTMRNLYENSNELHNNFDANMKAVVEKHTWDRSAQMMIDLYDGIVPKKVYGEMI